MQITISIVCIIVAAFYIYKYYNLLKQIKIIKNNIKFIEQRETQVELKSQNTELKELIIVINELTTKYKNDNIMINNSNKLFKETITSISHDLRTPLATANGYIGMLNKETLTNQQQDYVKITNERIEAVKILLDQLFEFARIEADEIELNMEYADLNSIIRDVIANYYNDFISKNCIPNLNINDEPFIVWIDKEVLTRVISNIIYNSLVHGDGQYAIYTSKQNSNYIIEITNHSSTILKEDMEYIFTKFYTSDKSRSKKTTGLGLSIAEKLVAKMDGEIKAELNDEMFSIKIKFKV